MFENISVLSLCKNGGHHHKKIPKELWKKLVRQIISIASSAMNRAQVKKMVYGYQHKKLVKNVYIY